MKSKFFLQVITVVLSFFAFCLQAGAAPVAEDEAIEWANSTGAKLIEALGSNNLESKYAALDKMFANDVDGNYIARFVIGKYWKEMSAEQQKKYNALFNRYMLSLYKNYPLDFEIVDINFTITSVRAGKLHTAVFCTVTLPEKIANDNFDHVNLEFTLRKTGGKIKITDLKIGESSLLLTYRGRFYQMIKDADEDIEWFLEDLESLTVSNERNAEEKLNL
jgi:phospholipid transport system substrate-binding protein